MLAITWEGELYTVIGEIDLRECRWRVVPSRKQQFQ